HELEAAILSQEPRRPSAMAREAAMRATTPRAQRRRLAGDLDAIILRAIEKDPSRRYGSVAELAADLRRHLGDEPVLARRAVHRVDAFVYRTGKLWRRHRFAVVATLIVVATLAAALGIVSQQARRLAAERDRAERTFGAFTGVFEEGLRQHGGTEVRVAELLATAARGSRRELAAEPVVRTRLLGVLASLSHQLGRLGQSAELSTEALTVAREAGLDPIHDVEPLYRLGVAQHGRGEMREAAATLSRALARLDGRPSPFVAPIYTEMAQIRWKLGDRMARDHLARRALSQLDDPETRPTDDPVQLAILRGDLSALVWERDAAVAAFDEAYRLSRRRFGDAHPTTAWSRCKLGAMQRVTGPHASARQHLLQAMDFLRASGDDRLRSEECDHLTLGRALLDWRDWRGAETAYWFHYERMVERDGPVSRAATFAQMILASTIMQQGDLETAELLLVDGLAGVRELAGDDSAATAPFYCTLGELTLLANRPARAEEAFEACAERFPPHDAFGRLWVDFGHGRVALRRGEPARAIAWLERSYDAITASVADPASSADRAEIGIEYAEALAAVGRIDDAITVYEAARSVHADPDLYCDGEPIVAEIDARLAELRG
ncbi:MAG: tetratricopeptide repeat protein, partial [Acidobacteriota bacterium]